MQLLRCAPAAVTSWLNLAGHLILCHCHEWQMTSLLGWQNLLLSLLLLLQVLYVPFHFMSK